MLIDTDVIIWHLRGNKRAANRLGDLTEFSISAVTYMELVQGLRNKQELRLLRAGLRDWNAMILPIDETISNKAMFYVEQYFLSHSLQLADALIAATAVTAGLPLLTANTKHYRVVSDLMIEKFEPRG